MCYKALNNPVKTSACLNIYIQVKSYPFVISFIHNIEVCHNLNLMRTSHVTVLTPGSDQMIKAAGLHEYSELVSDTPTVRPQQIDYLVDRIAVPPMIKAAMNSELVSYTPTVRPQQTNVNVSSISTKTKTKK